FGCKFALQDKLLLGFSRATRLHQSKDLLGLRRLHLAVFYQYFADSLSGSHTKNLFSFMV
ncbi:MAG: hypothetical protein IKW24_05585, partial [Clostridia bacterium]|nr:hypothetical protein [Clostridia bacterium]